MKYMRLAKNISRGDPPEEFFQKSLILAIARNLLLLNQPHLAKALKQLLRSFLGYHRR